MSQLDRTVSVLDRGLLVTERGLHKGCQCCGAPSGLCCDPQEWACVRRPPEPQVLSIQSFGSALDTHTGLSIPAPEFGVSGSCQGEDVRDPFECNVESMGIAMTRAGRAVVRQSSYRRMHMYVGASHLQSRLDLINDGVRSSPDAGARPSSLTSLAAPGDFTFCDSGARFPRGVGNEFPASDYPGQPPFCAGQPVRFDALPHVVMTLSASVAVSNPGGAVPPTSCLHTSSVDQTNTHVGAQVAIRRPIPGKPPAFEFSTTGIHTGITPNPLSGQIPTSWFGGIFEPTVEFSSKQVTLTVSRSGGCVTELMMEWNIGFVVRGDRSGEQIAWTRTFSGALLAFVTGLGPCTESAPPPGDGIPAHLRPENAFPCSGCGQ